MRIQGIEMDGDVGGVMNDDVRRGSNAVKGIAEDFDNSALPVTTTTGSADVG